MYLDYGASIQIPLTDLGIRTTTKSSPPISSVPDVFNAMGSMMKAMVDQLANTMMHNLDVEMNGILQAAYGNVGASQKCLHYCKCGKIGEHLPNYYGQIDKKCGIALNIKCNTCAVNPRHIWYRFKWRKG